MAFQNTSSKKGKKKKVLKRQTVCALCQNGVGEISYTDSYRLKKFISRKGKIISRFRTGNCNRHQNNVTRSIKRARQMSILPYFIKD